MSVVSVSSTHAQVVSQVEQFSPNSSLQVHGTHFEIVSDLRPWKFNHEDQCPISCLTFAELSEEKAPVGTRIFQILGPRSSTKFNSDILTIINRYTGDLFFGERQDYFVALVKDTSANSALYDVEALREFYRSKNWQIFTNPINRQPCMSVTVLGICIASGIVRRYQTCQTVQTFSELSYSPNLNLNSTLEYVDEEEFLNWIEMEIRTNGWCNDFNPGKIIARFNKYPLTLLENLAKLFDRLICPIGFARLGFFYRSSNELIGPESNNIYPFGDNKKAILFFEKALRLIPPLQPNSERSLLLCSDDTNVYESLASSYTAEERHMDALNSIKKAMQLCPEYRRDLRTLLLAKIHKRLGNYEEAERQLKAILQWEKSECSITMRSQVYIELAEISGMCNRYDLAREHVISALKESKETYGWEIGLKVEVERVSKNLECAEKAMKLT